MKQKILIQFDLNLDMRYLDILKIKHQHEEDSPSYFPHSAIQCKAS